MLDPKTQHEVDRILAQADSSCPIVKVCSLTDYCELTSYVGKKWREQSLQHFGHEKEYSGTITPWFRGTINIATSLTPTLARAWLEAGRGFPSIFDLEEYFYSRFARHARALLEGKLPEDEVEWNCLMRRHGIPSRLLDWTIGSLIALGHATHWDWQDSVHSSYPNSSASNSSAVWMLQPQRLMELATTCLFGARGIRNISSGNPRIIAMRRDFFRDPMQNTAVDSLSNYPYWHHESYWKYPLPLIPKRVSARIQLASDRFTLHSLNGYQGSNPHLDPKPDSNLSDFAHDAFLMDGFWYLLKIEIPPDCIHQIARELSMTGVSLIDSTQDLDSLSRDITRRFHLGFSNMA